MFIHFFPSLAGATLLRFFRVARHIRLEVAGCGYHVMTRGNRWATIFVDDEDHLFIETPEPNLVDAMKWLQNTVMRCFNAPPREWGRLLGDRYKTTSVEGESGVCRALAETRCGNTQKDHQSTSYPSISKCLAHEGLRVANRFAKGLRGEELSDTDWVPSRGANLRKALQTAMLWENTIISQANINKHVMKRNTAIGCWVINRPALSPLVKRVSEKLMQHVGKMNKNANKIRLHYFI